MSETTTETQPRQDFMVALDLDDHHWLQDEAIRRSRDTGRRVHMTDVARSAIKRERARVAALKRRRENGSS